MLLDFANLSVPEIILIVIASTILATIALIVYCIVNILRSNFKTSINKYLFLLLVIFAPFVGSIIYLIVRKDYIKPKDHHHFPSGN